MSGELAWNRAGPPSVLLQATLSPPYDVSLAHSLDFPLQGFPGQTRSEGATWLHR